MQIAEIIAEELQVKRQQVEATLKLLQEGATVPFIARYRKEATGGLDDVQLRQLQERLVYLTELEDRRATVLKSIEDQGNLNDSLKQAILEVKTKIALEDLYRPYMPKRRTKGQIAIEAGLEPLALSILQDSSCQPASAAKDFINPDKNIDDINAALEGARYILMERFADDAALLGNLRELAWQQGWLVSNIIKGKEQEGKKFSDYFDYQERTQKIPSHRALALFRAAKEGILRVSLVFDMDEPEKGEKLVARHFSIDEHGDERQQWLFETARQCWKIKLSLALETDIKRRLKDAAEQEAIRVFSRNLNDLLLAAPAGNKVTMGLDPGLRTGVKLAIVDATGKVLATDTIYPHPPQKQWKQALQKLAALIQQFNVELIAIGNGTASRETDQLVAELERIATDSSFKKIVVSEAGASVYSASELASKELPKLDVSLRGAVSIARRLQDPLAELVKIDPKSIGVGQYQHDVNQVRLNRALDAAVEDCVNAVGVDVNTASPKLLERVAGLNISIANNIVSYRENNGKYNNRQCLLSVPRLGQKAFEQCAGFLRIPDGDNPLDASAVHPEAYSLVEKILRDCDCDIKTLIGDKKFLKKLNPKDFVDDKFGEPTVQDIFKELEKPGRDPRPEFVTAKFKEDVKQISDLAPGMSLQGCITNVTNFGAFVDIGVHQDGLIHISELADNYVSDPHSLVKAGEIVTVRVIEVDVARKRISLSMKKGNKAQTTQNSSGKNRGGKPQQKSQNKNSRVINTAMADAFSKLKSTDD